MVGTLLTRTWVEKRRTLQDCSYREGSDLNKSVKGELG